MHLTDQNNDHDKRALVDGLAVCYGIRSELKGLNGLAPAGRMVRDSVDVARCRLRGHQPLVKDPIALLSAEWLQRTLGMDRVVPIRHPGAFAHGIKDPLARHAGRLTAFAARERDITDQAGLLWRVLVDGVLGFCRRRPSWRRRPRNDPQHAGQRNCR
jgi:hypothetical protein